jgi:hypothetical protein
VLVEYDALVDRLRPHFHGAFQELAQMPTAGILAKLLREDLLLQSEIRARVDRFMSNRFSARTVGVHVRYSDYRVRIFAIIKQLNALLKRKRDLQIFLATDNIEIKKMFEGNFPGVVSAPHWYAKPGSPIHVDRIALRRIHAATGTERFRRREKLAEFPPQLRVNCRLVPFEGKLSAEQRHNPRLPGKYL